MIYDFGLQGQSASEFIDVGVTPAPGMLYVSVHDPSVGRELWTISTFRPPGDLNGDLELNATDLDLLHAASIDNSNESAFDLDQSGSISKADIDYWLSEYFDTPLGDVNLDRIVDALDWTIIASHLGHVATSGVGDLNVDNVIDTADLEIWHSHRFQRSHIAIETPSMREPFAPLTADVTGDNSIAILRLRDAILLRRRDFPATRKLLG
jgi:hypothetical protein